jgi:hypothetical protein
MEENEFCSTTWMLHTPAALQSSLGSGNKCVVARVFTVYAKTIRSNDEHDEHKCKFGVNDGA